MNNETRALRNTLFVAAQYLLPQHRLSRATGALARCEIRALKDWLIRRFIAQFGVDMSEAADPDPAAYAHFNAFFTRALKPGARVIDSAADSIVSPADGAVSQIGRIESGRILQAKNHWYSAADLLADPADARAFADGAFATIYLSPRDYHRVHMPLAARLTRLRYVPGRLFSVDRATADGVPGVFARNERVVCLFETAHGPFALVLVGAMIVAGIETVWTGAIAPPGRQVLTIEAEMADATRRIDKGAEMGRFLLGSTVILLLPAGTVDWDSTLAADSPLRMGQRIGRLL